MPVNPALRQLDIDIPAQPQALARLARLLAADSSHLPDIAALIECDMALASAVLRAVNSSLYGLKGRVQSVQQAATYLGLREISAITFEIGLRAAFPPAAELEPVWQRAATRGSLMAGLATLLSLDAWAAHSAGLFEECGKAVLFRHDSDRYTALLRTARSDSELQTLERASFGVSHDALGAALCDSWGLGGAAVACVRNHVLAQRTLVLSAPPARRGIAALSVLAQVLMTLPDTLDAVARVLAPQAGFDADVLQRAARQALLLQEQARHRGRA